jgi:pyruvate ferredoxin oxidoreductase alpha subunit
MQALEGSQAMAKAVGLCRPGVIAAYPITPQTHIVEHLADLVADGYLQAEYVSAESEFSAASIVLGAASAGARSFTATASQGLAFMTEVLYNIAGLRVPLVLLCANRALSAPISIWNDHQDSMAVRDCGFIQLYCADNQEAIDTIIQAFKLSETLEMPVTVCVDGYTLTHTLEGLILPTQEMVDSFLPSYHFSRTLNAQSPLSLGMMVPPDYFTEVRFAHDQAMRQALETIEQLDQEWATISGRSTGALLTSDRKDGAKLGILTIGSIYGTFYDAWAEHDALVDLFRLRAFRPFPAQALREAVAHLDDLIVVERSFSPGAGGVIANEVRSALSLLDQPPKVHAAVVGLGGRNVTLSTYDHILKSYEQGVLRDFAIADRRQDLEIDL